MINLLSQRAGTLHLGIASYCWFIDPDKALCLKLGQAKDRSRPLAGMCDSARYPQATHHPCHRPVWASAATSSRVFIGKISRTQKTEKARLTAEAERAEHVVAAIDAALAAGTGGVHGQDQGPRPDPKRGSDPGCHGPAPLRRTPTRRPMRPQDPRERAGVTRTGFYPKKDRDGSVREGPYQHLGDEFVRRLAALREAGEVPDPRDAQIERLKAQNAELKDRLVDRDETIEKLSAFKKLALSRLAAQHEEITHLRSPQSSPEPPPPAKLTTVPRARTTVIGTCN